MQCKGCDTLIESGFYCSGCYGKPESYFTQLRKEKCLQKLNGNPDNLLLPETYNLELQAYIKEHNYQELTAQQLIEIIEQEKFSDTLKRVWIKEIQQNLSIIYIGNTCKNCGNSIPDWLNFCSKSCVDHWKNVEYELKEHMLQRLRLEKLKELKDNPEAYHKALNRLNDQNNPNASFMEYVKKYPHQQSTPINKMGKAVMGRLIK